MAEIEHLLGVSRCGRVVEVDNVTLETTREYNYKITEDMEYLETDDRWDFNRDFPSLNIVLEKNWKDINCFCCKNNKKMDLNLLGYYLMLMVTCTSEEMHRKEGPRELERTIFCINLKEGGKMAFRMKNGFKWCYPEPIDML
jgi:hypothetical protein